MTIPRDLETLSTNRPQATLSHAGTSKPRIARPGDSRTLDNHAHTVIITESVIHRPHASGVAGARPRLAQPQTIHVPAAIPHSHSAARLPGTRTRILETWDGRGHPPPCLRDVSTHRASSGVPVLYRFLPDCTARCETAVSRKRDRVVFCSGVVGRQPNPPCGLDASPRAWTRGRAWRRCC